MTAPTLCIADAHELGERLGVRVAIIVTVDDAGRIAGASWGRSVADCRGAGRTLDQIVDHLGDGRLPAPFTREG